MSNLDAKAVEGLLAEYQLNQLIAKKARDRNRVIADTLGYGTTKGLYLMACIAPATRTAEHLNVRLLKAKLPRKVWAPFLCYKSKSRTVAIRPIESKRRRP